MQLIRAFETAPFLFPSTVIMRIFLAGRKKGIFFDRSKKKPKKQTSRGFSVCFLLWNDRSPRKSVEKVGSCKIPLEKSQKSQRKTTKFKKIKEKTIDKAGKVWYSVCRKPGDFGRTQRKYKEKPKIFPQKSQADLLPTTLEPLRETGKRRKKKG